MSEIFICDGQSLDYQTSSLFFLSLDCHSHYHIWPALVHSLFLVLKPKTWSDAGRLFPAAGNSLGFFNFDIETLITEKAPTSTIFMKKPSIAFKDLCCTDGPRNYLHIKIVSFSRITTSFYKKKVLKAAFSKYCVYPWKNWGTLGLSNSISPICQS